MQTNSIKLYSLNYLQLKTYIIASLFIIGNIVTPQIAHLLPNGGVTFLPIYFFTLIGAYKYGWKVGLITAILSPIINNLLFGMPPTSVLPIILIKSSLLAVSAGLAAYYFKRISIPILILVILSYQTIGTLIEWAIVKDTYIAIQDFRMGIPGMLLQIFGCYFIIKYFNK